MADWRAGQLSGDRYYEIHDELFTPDGRVVGVIECFATVPDIFYATAITPEGIRVRLGACSCLVEAKLWAERQAGLTVPPQPIKRLPHRTRLD